MCASVYEMGTLNFTLEHKSPINVNGVTLDPKPDWTFDDLISELHSLQLKQAATVKSPIFTKTQPRDFPKKSKVFVMRAPDYGDTVVDDEENQDPNMVVGKRFGCADYYVSDSDSDSSEDELALEGTQVHLMDPVGLLEGLLYERELEHQNWVEEEIRRTIDLLEMDLLNENGRLNSAHMQLERLAEVRREMDRKSDTQYRRKIAEALDNHLIAVQRNHEHKSQIEERKIRNDAAFEEAKRKEKAIQEEKVRQEKAKAEAEALKRRTEEAQKEAERQVKKEAEAKKVFETTKPSVDEKDLRSKPNSIVEPLKETKDRDSSIRAADRALKAEAERQQKYNNLVQKKEALGLSSDKDFRSFEQQIGRHIKQIAGSRENLRKKATELSKIINDPSCPQVVSVIAFAKKMVSRFESVGANFDSTAFACGHVIVLVTSQVPLAMDIFLAELHKACIYTVPKHIVKQKSGLNEEAYQKALGYREEDGKIESKEQYLSRLESFMKLYGALVQTDIDGVRNLHGIEEGWAWLARLLNSLPANLYTAVAVNAFLKMAGFKLYRKFKSQFGKILNLISNNFVGVLEQRGHQDLAKVIMEIKLYINNKQYLKEPEGWQMQTSLLSGDERVLDSDSNYHQNQYYQNQYYYQGNRW